MGLDLTLEQKAAVEHRGGALLVSAAAGSGKTKVLVERLLSHIGDGNDIGEYLVITYTRAAAAELRMRISDEIQERLADSPDNNRLRRQSMLCRAAPIDTIHGFCGDVLRENADLAGLPPDFRVADEAECDIIKAGVLEDVLDLAYETIETADGFRQLIDMASPGRDDRRTAEIVLDAYSKLRSDPSPRTWVEEQRKRLAPDGVSDVSETIWGAYLVDRARRATLFWLGEMEGLRQEMRESPNLDQAYGECVEASIHDIRAFLDALDHSWDEACRCSVIDFSRVKPKRISGYEDAKDVRVRCRTAMRKIADILAYPSIDHIGDMRAVEPAMTALLDLLMEFDSAYTREKRRRGIVDFSDLEHLTLSLLIDKETGGKTTLAGSISRRFKEIMVDEYQDVNAVQESIFNAVSSDGGNIFMVGDVKQSIYRFRLADPSIFIEKYMNFKEAGSQGPEGGSNPRLVESGTGSGTKILLSKNFRSRPMILEAVNHVFGKIMSAGSGEIDYTIREYLAAGRDDNGGSTAASLEIIDMSSLDKGDEDEESPAGTQIEAQYIAKRIAELTNGEYTIPDGEGNDRSIRYSDIVILLRSMRDKAWQYAAALTESGIPVDFPGGEGFFETLEISAALSILAVIDNPMQDIPLAAALSCPVYGFTADELAEIRGGSRNIDFYSALLQAAGRGAGDNDGSRPPNKGIEEKCAAFLDEMDALRESMPDMPADRFIWHVYGITGLVGRVGAMRGGERRRRNLILLAEQARIYEKNGYKGLYSFLAYIRMLQERGTDISQDRTASISSVSTEDAVRIISIHKSKGLEFPVVILADMSKRFNNMDAHKPLVMHPKLGFGPKRTDNERRIEYTTLARMAVQSKLTSEMLAEEMRVLYVAMTRARERLIVTATYADAEKMIEKLSMSGGRGTMREAGETGDMKIAPQILEGAKSMSEWILLALAADPGQTAWEIGIIPASLIGDGRYVGIDGSRVSKLKPDSDPMPPIPNRLRQDTGLSDRVPGASFAADPVKPEDVEILSGRFSFIYPYAKAPELPSKMTVTGLKDRDFDSEAAILSEKSFTYRKPRFIAEGADLTGAERGTALHLAMQYIDYQKCANAAAVGAELERLTDAGLLDERQAAVIDTQKIVRFFESGIGQRAQKAESVMREFRFSLLYPAERFYPGGGDDTILLQGVIDCFFEEDGEICIIDFKTDRMTQGMLEDKVKHYSPQLAAYSDALERVTGKHVKECVIYFFELDRPVAAI